jgi:hypothetical protein
MDLRGLLRGELYLFFPVSSRSLVRKRQLLWKKHTLSLSVSSDASGTNRHNERSVECALPCVTLMNMTEVSGEGRSARDTTCKRNKKYATLFNIYCYDNDVDVNCKLRSVRI